MLLGQCRFRVRYSVVVPAIRRHHHGQHAGPVRWLRAFVACSVSVGWLPTRAPPFPDPGCARSEGGCVSSRKLTRSCPLHKPPSVPHTATAWSNLRPAKQRRIIPDELFGRGLKGSILSTHAHPSITMCPRNLSITTFWPSTLGLRSPSECGRTPGWVVGERLTSPHRGVCRAHPHPPHP